MSRGQTAHVVAISSPTLVTNAIHDPSEPGVDEVSHVGHLCSEHLAFAVAADGPISDAGQLLDTMRSTGTSVAIATALGNVNHAAVSIVARAAGGSPSSLEIAAHASARIAVSEVETHRSTVAVVSAASTFEGLERATLRVVAVSAVEPPRGLLDGTPRWRDLEVDCALETWRGVVGPPDLSDDDIAEWDTTLDAALRSSAWHEALQRFAWIDARRNAAGAARFVAAEDGALRDALAGVAI